MAFNAFSNVLIDAATNDLLVKGTSDPPLDPGAKFVVAVASVDDPNSKRTQGDDTNDPTAGDWVTRVPQPADAEPFQGGRRGVHLRRGADRRRGAVRLGRPQGDRPQARVTGAGEGPVDDDERCRNRLDPALEGGARHGVAAPRGLGTAAASSRGGRFGRLFEDLARRDPGAEAVEVLADRMHVARGTDEANTRIGAGYTYLGQFVDHDITFDPTSRLERDNDPDALVNFRTPRFDLDSLYGSGPADQPFLYDWTRGPYPGVKLLAGRNPPGGELAEHDLPRNAQGRATIGDARNDENLIVAQLHLLFLRFHNKVVERTHESQPWLTRNDLFDEAQRIVRWHYQWIVVHEFLERIVGKPMAQAVRPNLVIDHGVVRPTTERKLFAWSGEPAIPVEFSAAAYRFGHSMVRSGYPVAAGGTRGADPPRCRARNASATSAASGRCKRRSPSTCGASSATARRSSR